MIKYKMYITLKLHVLFKRIKRVRRNNIKNPTFFDLSLAFLRPAFRQAIF